MSHQLDLSSFPLLRIDEVHLHDLETLIKSEEGLSNLVQQQNTEHETLISFASKLVEIIRHEIAFRRVDSLLQHCNSCFIDHGTCHDNDEVPSICNTMSNENALETNNIATSQSSSAKDGDYKWTKRLSRKGINDSHRVIAYHEKRRNSDMKKGQFIVIPSNKDKYHGSFRSRAKLYKSAIKAREQITSEETLRKQFEERRMTRRRLALERLKERRKAKELRRCEEKEKLKSKHQSVLQEMSQVANEVKSSIVGSGHTEIRGNAEAAMAAAEVYQQALIDVCESDSGSSLGSEVENFGDDEVSELIEDRIPEQNTNMSDFQHHYDDVKINVKTTGGERNIISEGELEGDQSLHAEIELSDGQDKQGETNFEEDQHNMSIPVSGTTIVTTPITLNSNEFCCGFDVEDGMKKNDEGEINWQPWLVKNCNDIKVLQKQQQCYTKCENAFTDIFPTFNHIFTAFSNQNTKSHGMNDNMFCKERACLEYQLILQQNLATVSLHHNNKYNDFFLEHDLDPAPTSTNYLFKIISSRPEVGSIISDVLISPLRKDFEWSDITDEHGLGNCWNLLWTWKKPKINPEHLLVCQKISRFQQTNVLTRKDYLKKKLETFCSIKHSKPIMPKTFILPSEYNHFIQSFNACKKNKNEKSNIWILKPIAMSRGRGISLVDDIGDVSYSTPSIIQKYISSPLLFKGFKFDLRLYVTVLSFTPLEAYIYKEGFARFSSKPFATQMINDLQMHLTNSSIQKEYTDDIDRLHPVTIAGKDGGGNKVKVSWLWENLDSMGVSSKDIWKQISELCWKTLCAVCSEIPHQPNAFELFGFDVMIDNTYRPWLIEVNSCPSLARDTEVDAIVKERLIEDTIQLVNPSKIDRAALKEICERRLYKTKASIEQNISVKERLEKDLRKIFCNCFPRKFGDLNDELNYEYLGGLKAD